jgi:hypothetical protein
LVLSTTDQLLAVRQRHLGLRHREVVVCVPGLSPEARASTAQRLTDLLAACGCDTGAVGMVVGAVLTVVALLAGHHHSALGLVALSPLVLAGTLAGAGVGKAFGLARSRRRFRHEIDALLSATAGTKEG